MSNELFISYSHRDKIVHFIVKVLQDRGLRPWFDKSSIPPASPWREACLEGAQKCDSLLFLLSPNSAISPPCAMELEEALKYNKRIIPMLLDAAVSSAIVHPALARLNWLRFDEDPERAIAQLFELLDGPRGSMLHLTDRPSAILDIIYSDQSRAEVLLYRDCYWIGRQPNPPISAAGGINLKERNPKQPAISILHLILVVIDCHWVAMDTAKNGSLLFSKKSSERRLPPYPPGWALFDGDQLDIFGNQLTYREINLKSSETVDSSECPTFPGFEVD